MIQLATGVPGCTAAPGEAIRRSRGVHPDDEPGAEIRRAGIDARRPRARKRRRTRRSGPRCRATNGRRGRGRRRARSLRTGPRRGRRARGPPAGPRRAGASGPSPSSRRANSRNAAPRRLSARSRAARWAPRWSCRAPRRAATSIASESNHSGPLPRTVFHALAAKAADSAIAIGQVDVDDPGPEAGERRLEERARRVDEDRDGDDQGEPAEEALERASPSRRPRRRRAPRGGTSGSSRTRPRRRAGPDRRGPRPGAPPARATRGGREACSRDGRARGRWRTGACGPAAR